MKIYFDHEKLDVYREAIDFCAWAGELLNTIAAKAAAKDRARFLEIARGSALECAACLDVLVARKLAAPKQIENAKENLARIVQMLMGMLRRFSERGDFLREDPGEYGFEHEQEEGKRIRARAGARARLRKGEG